jgi:hypothetical protein
MEKVVVFFLTTFEVVRLRVGVFLTLDFDVDRLRVVFLADRLDVMVYFKYK